MKKYKQNRRLITVICDECGDYYDKPLSEYNRNQALGRKGFCSRSCTGKSFIPRLAEYRKISLYDISAYCKNKVDEFTTFRYYHRSCRSRFKECNVPIYDLKEQWELQNGKCPYSGVDLILRTYAKKVINPIYGASLDRIDSSKGYIKGNIQFVSIAMNYMKSTMSHEQTMTLCQIIATNFKISTLVEDQTISSSL